MNNCIGCQACVEFCPAQCISFSYDIWGEGKASIDENKCLHCGICNRICPGEVMVFSSPQKFVFAVISNSNSKTGSSGGVFFELAEQFILNGGVVLGAAFDSNLKLKHQKATTVDEIIPLCKSKYLHSDMSGVYKSIKNLLESNTKVMFVGTPCQVSAVKNLFSEKHKERLFLVDFLCHGTGTQKVFDSCIREEEKRNEGKITDFCFRSKAKVAEHSFTYKINKKGKEHRVSGYSFEFPYYHSFLQYTIFNDACYSCKYATSSRVGDITLGDFWGVGKYNSKLNPEKGVSMVCVNTKEGEVLFDFIKKSCKIIKYPSKYAIENNKSFYEPEPFPEKKRKFVELLEKKGESALVSELSCKNVKKLKYRAKVPKFLKKIYHKMKGR